MGSNGGGILDDVCFISLGRRELGSWVFMKGVGIFGVILYLLILLK